MHQPRRSRFALLSFLFVVTPATHANQFLRVNESATKARLHEQTLAVSLVVENTSGASTRAQVGLELLNPKSESCGRAMQVAELSPGSKKIEIDIAMTALKPADANDVFWYRLAYKISAAGQSVTAQFEPVTGLISVSEISPQMFQLEMEYPGLVKVGTTAHAFVRAVQPVSLRPVAGVKIEAALAFDNTAGRATIKSSSTTDSRGYAPIDFMVPPNTDDDSPDLTVIANHGGYTAKIEDAEISTIRFSKFLMSTDKPLYQPGQTVHTRVLAFGIDKYAIPNLPIELRVLDPDETLVYKTEMKTSKFGIASADWTIPANQLLGDYRLQTDLGEDDAENGGGSISVKVSRYELPNFTVLAKADRSYYLSGQNAEVTVHADYLFGQPVNRGHVRVVRENSRTWNYHDQKWDIDEGAVYEGDADTSGKFVAKLDLSDDHKTLAGEDYIRFEDQRYTAYFTDPSTRRTEERRFDLRLTKEPIHIYVIHNGSMQMQHSVDFYISTSYADGTPASCDVTAQEANFDSSAPGNPIHTVHTNRFGVAKVIAMPMTGEGDNRRHPLVFHATDAKGLTGVHTEDFYFSGTHSFRIRTDKVLYRPGDPIQARIESDDSDTTAEIEVSVEGRFISSQSIHLRHGHASFTLPADDKFLGPVTISAYRLGVHPTGYFEETSIVASRTVLFPHDTSLQLDVHTSKATYRPGEEARADFHISASDGTTPKGALGLVVVDKAVDERVRTDQDLRNGYGFYAFWYDWYSDEQISGISLEDLNKLDLSKRLPDGYELAAEILLEGMAPYTRFDTSEDSSLNLHGLFQDVIDPPLANPLGVLRAEAAKPRIPLTETDVRSFLDSINLTGLRDPWGTPYITTIEAAGPTYLIHLKSAGPDKKPDTGDDFEITQIAWPYFAGYSAAIQKAMGDYHARTGAYIRDLETLRSELTKQNIAVDSLRDPWGHAYRFEFGIEQSCYTIAVTSAGPDGKFAAGGDASYDDFIVSTNRIDYFQETRNKMDSALERFYQDAGKFPQTQEDLLKILSAAGIDWQSLRDGWGHPYYATFRQEARYIDSVVVQNYADYQGGKHVSIHPVTGEMNYVDIRSSGPDGKLGTEDDFDAATFSRAVYLADSTGRNDPLPRAVLSGELGAISGTVTDPSGAVIAGVKVTATRIGTDETHEAETGADGKYTIQNVRPGTYQLRFSIAGFRDTIVTAVPVSSSAITQLNAAMQIGSVSETVTVEAAVESVQTQSVSLISEEQVKSLPSSKSPKTATAKIVNAVSTPRLREYFPETLLWQPEVITDSGGTAHVKFALADSITTWKLSAIASTADGRIGTAEKEVRAFQPFFADQDLPQFMTAGDEIGLPVILRNYLDHSESVDLKVDPQPWLALLGPATQHTSVDANDSARAIFSMRAESPVKDGKQRVTALAKDASDAIEKKITVRPFGEEKTANGSQLLEGSAALTISIPADALPGSSEAELKIYPKLMAHVWEAIDAILERPYGCGEQTISSTYPSILLLRYAKQAGRENAPEMAKARKYAQLGYDRLLSYQDSSGGFSYWGHNEKPDVALTAYAVMFLHDAKDVIPVDDSVAHLAQTWLLNQIQEDGHWAAHYYWNDDENVRQSAMLTAYVARVLALTLPRQTSDSVDHAFLDLSNRELVSALSWLSNHSQEQDEPYMIASYALALLNSETEDNRAAALKVLDRLRSLAHTEAGTSYWSLETNTPFYGWGRAGRLETTALVLEALERGTALQPAANDRALMDRAMLFLLRNQDRYGIWYSTQATINVLRAMAASLSGSVNTARDSQATILVDGKPAATIRIPGGGEMSSPVTADLSKALGPGEHKIEINRAAGAPEASVQLAETYYVPWAAGAHAESVHKEKNSDESLRLAVSYDRTSAKVGEKIDCTVKAERVDFRGYGMMLAEIGLPPGAEVDRDSLDKAMTTSGWGIHQFDVLPDRIIVYLWPQAGGTTFSFDFKTRFSINAETTPSILYDYYNPDAQALAAPTRIVAQ
ncbi:MAG TPA: MG2 domain-containing protein [Candidatus Acidoferrum sp.]|nr:MG2 domain-containing protein [Candidatus Acidoferrum sp.]